MSCTKIGVPFKKLTKKACKGYKILTRLIFTMAKRSAKIKPKRAPPIVNIIVVGSCWTILGIPSKTERKLNSLPSGINCIKFWYQSDAKIVVTFIKTSSPDNDSFYHTSAVNEIICYGQVQTLSTY